MTFTERYLDETVRIAQALDVGAIDRVVKLQADVRARGVRLFFLGVGGSAGNASHAVNDFRKLAQGRRDQVEVDAIGVSAIRL